MKKRIINVREDDNIISLLGNNGISKNKVKTFVKLGFVSVNNKVINKLPQFVKDGDEIVIDDSNKIDLDIIYEDDNYLVVNKENGLLTKIGRAHV